MIIAAVLVFLFILLTALGAYIVIITSYPKTKDYDFTYENEVEKGVFTEEYYAGLTKDEVMISSPFGYEIHGIWIPLAGSDKTIVLSHGYTYSLFGSIKYIPVFQRLGFNVFVYDQRYHGLSGGDKSTFGFKEKEDLSTVFDYLESRFDKNMVIGTHGESLGGSTVLLHGAVDERVKFIISDCAYMDMRIQIAHRLKVEYHIPAFPVIYFASFINRIVSGNFYSQVSPIREVTRIKAPTMIIHGRADEYTPYEQGLNLYQKLKVKKRFYGAEGAGHAESLKADEEKYYQEVKLFLGEVL